LPNIILDNQIITYKIIASKRRKTIGITIDVDNGIIVRYPSKLNPHKIEIFLHDKKKWILSNLKKIDGIQRSYQEIQFVDDEILPFLGKKYRLQVVSTNSKRIKFDFIDNEFIASIPIGSRENEHSSKIKAKAIKWYKDKAINIINIRVTEFIKYIGKSPTDVKIKSYKARWGSCKSDGTLIFNWKIIIAPEEVLDYVIVHEMCHILTMNHSKKFKDKLSSIIPDYKILRKWLKVNGYSLKL